MEEKKMGELNDEALDEVSGGGDGSRQYVMAIVTTPVFSKPGKRSEIGELQMGHFAPYKGQSGEWYNIYFHGTDGWVRSGCTQIINY